MGMAAALLILLLAAPAAFAVQHTVGGGSGWAQSVDYTTWAASQTFTVGDTLLFQYGSTHSVEQVSQSDYTNCNTGNALKSYTGGSNTVSLDTAGAIYFICPTSGHCQGGMKLSINVTAASTTPGAPPPPGTTTPSPPTTSTSAPPPPKSGAGGNFGIVNRLVIGLSIVVVVVLSFAG